MQVLKCHNTFAALHRGNGNRAAPDQSAFSKKESANESLICQRFDIVRADALLATPRAMNNLPRYLYRALRPAEISAGYVLIPKAQKPFLAHPRLPQILAWNLGEKPEHAVREHQWDKPGNQYETSGVSTTPHFHRARYYAEYCDPTRMIVATKFIATIDATIFGALGICAHRVADYVPSSLISVPEDDEIILVCPAAPHFPKELIVGITSV